MGPWSHIVFHLGALVFRCRTVVQKWWPMQDCPRVKSKRLREAAAALALAQHTWPEGNLLLAGVPEDARAGLRPWFEPFAARGGDSLFRLGHTITHVYF